jgi:DNA-binding IclR family transcriptional regulator
MKENPERWPVKPLKYGGKGMNMAIKTDKKEEKTDRIALLVDILTRIAHTDTSFGVSELGREFSKNKVYISRLLSYLEVVGWVSKDLVSQKYKAGDELITFALSLTSRFYLPKITLSYLYELSDITDETTALSVRIGYERVLVQQIPSKKDKQQTAVLGQRYPLWLATTGKSMAAFLNDDEIDELINIMRSEWPAYKVRTFNTDQYRNELKEIKKLGYALSLADYRPDICALAAPIFSQNQTVIGALVVRGTSPPFTLEKAKKYCDVILEMTNKINREIKSIA